MRDFKLVGWAETEEQDAVFTPWSAVHASAGYVARAAGVGLVEWNLFHGLYECKDIFLQQHVSNSVPNSVGDQLSANIAYVVGPKMGMTFSLLALAVSYFTLGFSENLG